MTADPSKTKPIRDRRLSPRDWSISDVPERQCTAHKRNGDRCKNAAIRGGTVCGYHGGNAPAVKAKACLRLEMASDRLARQLLSMTTDPNVADPVKLAVDDEIVGEFDDDEIDDDLPRIQRQRESESGRHYRRGDRSIDNGYTDADAQIMTHAPGTTHTRARRFVSQR